ncbi:hypothetical protein HUO13_12030 [Saccharopolyspora erythraea]|uniref:hypothetical protein n=1 Tax=Saccharopolyspora erythraea TaxID=1836 RepID=UPI001BA4F8FC|nr:hypothetical protein [Saccharopolyspora erythraea]QUH01441.1 hypothetical protein HUO13_12030 [Saccharopolyspora erythraea]
MAWRVARSLDTLLAQFNARYPNRSKVSDGSIGDAAHASRSSDHNPWYGPGIVTARDFTHDPANGMDIDRLTDELAASRDPRIKYIIANGYILDSRPGNNPWRWVRYTGSNPHTKHFHLSVMPNASADDPRPWNLPSFGNASPAPAPAPAPAPTPEDADVQFHDTFPNKTNGKPISLGDALGFIDKNSHETRGMVQEIRDEVRKAVFELTYRHPSRVAGSEYADTMLGYSVNADRYGYELSKRMDALEKNVAKLVAFVEGQAK